MVCVKDLLLYYGRYYGFDMWPIYQVNSDIYHKRNVNVSLIRSNIQLLRNQT